MAAPTVTVYRNGDSTFPGKKLVVNRRQIRTMGALLDKVTRDTRMKQAARSIKTPTGRHTIKEIDSLETGGCYVAVGAEKFKPLAYTEIKDAHSKHSPRKEIEITPVKHSKLKMSARARKVAEAQSQSHKTIHVFRNGDDLYPSVKMLLDKRELASMDNILKVVTSKVRLQSGAVFWLFTLDGKEVKDTTELENGEQYVAVGHGKKFKKVAYSDDTLLSPRSRAPTKQQLKVSHQAVSHKPNKPRRFEASKGHKRKSSSSTSNSQASSHEDHHQTRKPTAEIQELIQERIQEEFIAQPPKERSPTPTNKESVFTASGVEKENAKEVQDDRETQEDKPIDQVAAEEVEEEELENEQENEDKNKNDNDKDETKKDDKTKKDDETKKPESRPNSGFGGFIEDLIEDVREKFDDDEDDAAKKNDKDDVKKDET